MTTQNIRLSRLSHPRGNLLAMGLLIVVFLGFGVVAEACIPDNAWPAAQTNIEAVDHQEIKNTADK